MEKLMEMNTMSRKNTCCALVVLVLIAAGSAMAATKALEWKFDGNLSDSSGNGIDAVGYPNAGAIVYDTGVSGQALMSDGTTSAYKTGLTSAQLPILAADAWSVNVWVYPTVIPVDWRILWSLGNKPSGGNSRSIYSSGYASGQGQITFVGIKTPSGGSATTTYVSTHVPWDINQWQMVTTTYDGAILRIYKNGTMIAMYNPTFLDAPGEVRVPTNPWNAYDFFVGKFDEFTVWRGALTGDEIEALIIPGVLSDLHLNEQVVYYTMDDPQESSTLPDHSGNANDGTLYGFTSPVSDWLADGFRGDALKFAGLQSIDPPAPISHPVSYTIGFWFESGHQDYRSAFYSEKQVNDVPGGYDKGTQFIIRLNTDQFQVFCKDRYYNMLYEILADGSDYLSRSQWHHLAVVADGEATQATLYLDGQPLASSPYVRCSHKTRQLNASIGYSWMDGQGLGSWTPTYLDDFKQWNYALSPAQIEAVAAMGNFNNDMRVDLTDFMYYAEDWLKNLQSVPGSTTTVANMESGISNWQVYASQTYSGTGTLSQTTNAYEGSAALQWNYSLPAATEGNYSSIVYDFGTAQNLSGYDILSMQLYRHTGNTAEELVFVKLIDASMQVIAEAWMTGSGNVVTPANEWAQWNIYMDALLGVGGQGAADKSSLTAIRYLMIGTGSEERTDARTGIIDIDDVKFTVVPVCSARLTADFNADCKVNLDDLEIFAGEWLLGAE